VQKAVVGSFRPTPADDQGVRQTVFHAATLIDCFCGGAERRVSRRLGFLDSSRRKPACERKKSMLIRRN